MSQAVASAVLRVLKISVSPEPITRADAAHKTDLEATLVMFGLFSPLPKGSPRDRLLQSRAPSTARKA